MPVSQSDRLGVTLWSSSQDIVDRQQFTDTYQNLEDRAALFGAGAVAGRPAASAATDRMFWYDPDTKVISYCDGTDWRNLNAYGAPAALAGDSAGSDGVATSWSRADHVHAMPGFGMPVAVSTALSEGDATTLVRSNHTHRLSSESIDSPTLFAPGVVDAAAIADGAVVAGKFAPGAISDPSMIANNSIVMSHLHPSVAVFPTGIILPWAGPTAPSGWLVCDGSVVSRSTYSGLFAVIGTMFGIGDGSTTFNLPNLSGRVPVGFKTGDTSFSMFGATGGTKAVSLSSSIYLPSHSHTINHTHNNGSGAAAGSHAHDISYGPSMIYGTELGLYRSGHEAPSYGMKASIDGAQWLERVFGTGFIGSVQAYPVADHTHTVSLGAYSGSSASAGGNGSHNNLQPYRVVTYIIRT